MPKQFAAHPCGWTDLLDAKLDRIAAIVPRQRTVVVVADDCRALAETQLRDYSEVKEVEMLRVN
jgi:mannose-1-phosphate guanylyltransferase